MKKFITVFLALAMVFAMSTVAFAAENTNLTINGEAGRSYEGFKLLKLETGLKADHVEHEGNCTDDCYAYSYTVNAKYLAVLQAEVFENVDGFAAAADVTEGDILDYFVSKESDGENGVYKSMREVADRLYKAIQDAHIDADITGLKGNNDSIEKGYWMFADVTNLEGTHQANSLVMVDTKGLDSLVITPKTGLPEIEKKVKDINDSDDDEITDNGWQDSADHDIGDVVPFKLTATLAENVAYYDTYKIVFHDSLSDGLTLDANSIKVYMFESDNDAKIDENGIDVTSSFASSWDALGDGCTFEVGCNNVLDIEGVDKDTVFVVYYEAELNEGAAIGSAGNPNKVYLEFSNNPYSDSTGKTEEDKVIVFTYQLTINKTDEGGNELQGAGFKLYKKNNAGEYELIGAEKVGGTMFVWEGLDDGDYKLEESTVPAGYNKMTDIEFSITAKHDEDAKEPALKELSGGDNLATGNVETGIIQKAIENKTGTVLPETGAAGTMGLILGGSALVIFAVVFMITRKKMSVYAD